MATIKLYNSLNCQKEIFEPLDLDHVRLYACGPTVYNYAHIGNARMAVVFDLWARLLRYIYPKVTYASNITDIEDKIINAAREEARPISEITEKYTKIYNQDMEALGCLRPDVQPKATEHVQGMIDLIQKLIDQDFAYVAEGHALFHVSKNPSYGVLSGRSRNEQIAGARVEIAPYKKDPADFVLWKPSNGDEPGWDSPFGYGRPGWHIECSAMTEAHLGLPFDIHGGGADLKFPHHENEIAQSCCAHGNTQAPESYAKYWVHNGFVTVEGEKMSKSLGNFQLARDLLKNHPGPVLRLTLLSAHYRQPLDWSKQTLHQMQIFYDRLRSATEKLESADSKNSQEVVYAPVLDALYDDLNTPLAFSKLGELVKEINKAKPDQYAHYKAILSNTLSFLGIEIEEKENKVSDDMKKEIEQLLKERTQARTDKNFARADEIRDRLTAMHVEIEDTPEGPKWHLK